MLVIQSYIVVMYKFHLNSSQLSSPGATLVRTLDMQIQDVSFTSNVREHLFIWNYSNQASVRLVCGWNTGAGSNQHSRFQHLTNVCVFLTNNFREGHLVWSHFQSIRFAFHLYFCLAWLNNKTYLITCYRLSVCRACWFRTSGNNVLKPTGVSRERKLHTLFIHGLLSQSG